MPQIYIENFNFWAYGKCSWHSFNVFTKRTVTVLLEGTITIRAEEQFWDFGCKNLRNFYYKLDDNKFVALNVHQYNAIVIPAHVTGYGSVINYLIHNKLMTQYWNKIPAVGCAITFL